MRSATCALRVFVRAAVLLAAIGIVAVQPGSAQIASTAKKQAATHRQVKTINVGSGQGQLKAFCVAPDGRILAVVQKVPAQVQFQINTTRQVSEESWFSWLTGSKPAVREVPTTVTVSQPAPTAAKESGCQVVVMDPNGELLKSWPVDFGVQAINVGPDGALYLAGSGRVAKWDMEGKQLVSVDTPLLKALKENPDLLKQRAKEQIDSQKKMYTTQLEQFRRQLAIQQQHQQATVSPQPETTATYNTNITTSYPIDQPAKVEDPRLVEDTFGVSSGPAHLQRKNVLTRTTAPARVKFGSGVVMINYEQNIQAYERALKQLDSQSLDQIGAQIGARLGNVSSVAPGENDVFIVTGADKGYGFVVWRMDLNLQNPKQIASDLSGCCGQMDIQCLKSDVFVAENSRHRVLRMDREGKRLASFGKTDRDAGGEGFGSCCNPMNLRFAGEENLYTSESDGQVKLFTPGGKFVEMVGMAKVNPGCKNSAIAVSPDRSKVYYIDIQKSQIIVLARSESVAGLSDNR